MLQPNHIWGFKKPLKNYTDPAIYRLIRFLGKSLSIRQELRCTSILRPQTEPYSERLKPKMQRTWQLNVYNILTTFINIYILYIPIPAVLEATILHLEGKSTATPAHKSIG